MSDKTNFKNYIIRTVGTTSVLNFIIVITGFIIDAIAVALLGLGTETDAFFAAYTIPLILANLIQEQSSKVLTPFLMNTRNIQGEKEYWHFLNIVINCNIGIFFALAILGSIFSKFIIRIQTPGFSESTLLLTAQIGAILFVFPLLRTLVNILKAALNTVGMFVLIPYCGIIANLFRLLFIIFYFKKFAIFSLAYGLLIGEAISIFIMLTVLFRQGYKYKLVISFNDVRLIKLWKLSIYPILGFGITEGIQIFQNFLASYLSAGNLSALRYATRITDALAGILSGGLVSIILPIIANGFSSKDISEVKDNIRKGLFVLFFITLPVTVWLILSNRELVSILFERAKFTSADTILTSTILALMCPYILLSRFIGVIETAFFGNLDTKTPLFNMLLLSLSYVVITLILFNNFSVYSFAIARSFSYGISSIFILFLFHRKIGSLDLRNISSKLVGVVFSSGALGISILICKTFLSFFNISNNITVFIIKLLIGAIAFLISSTLFKIINLNHIKALLSFRNNEKPFKWQ